MKQDLAAIITENMPTFSKGQKRIARIVMEEYEKAADMTAYKLGKAAGVSESTVVRFATELGFRGYPEFQHAVQDMLRSKLTLNQRIQVTNSRIGDGDLLSKVMLADMEKIKYTLDSIDREALERSVNAIIGAKQIYLVGVRSSSFLASLLSYNLGMIFDNVKFIQPTSTGEVFEQILSIASEDVLIAMSFPRYSSKVVKAVHYARSQGANVIALTDSTVSPIAAEADEVLTAQSDMASYMDSLVAPLSIINALVVMITKKMPDEVKERFDKLERLWDEYEVYAKQ